MSSKVSITKKQSKSPSKGKFCIGHSVGQPCLTPLMQEPMIFRNDATLSDHNYKYHMDMVYDPLTMIQLPNKGYYEWTIPDQTTMRWYGSLSAWSPVFMIWLIIMLKTTKTTMNIL